LHCQAGFVEEGQIEKKGERRDSKMAARGRKQKACFLK
jgi:hypothetical protein